jgi:hypothetical protein
MYHNVFQKQHFWPLHESVRENAENTLKSGFVKCGVYPCSVLLFLVFLLQPVMQMMWSTVSRNFLKIEIEHKRG